MNQQTRKDLRERCQVLYHRLYEELGATAQDAERSDYAFTLLSALVFSHFLQARGMLDGDVRYLQHRLEQCQNGGVSFSFFLTALLDSGLSTPTGERSIFAKSLLGRIPYLSGSLFPPLFAAPLSLNLPNQFFEEAIAALDPFTWTLVEGGTQEGLISPALLGALTEHQVEDRKTTGSFYTPAPICTYIARETCLPMILGRFKEVTGKTYDSLDKLISKLDARECGLLLFVILPSLTIHDPSCGAADFLIVALHQLVAVYEQVIAQAEGFHYPGIDSWIQVLDNSIGGRAFALRKRVVSQNISGVDILQLPLDTARRRLALNVLGDIRAVGVDMSLSNLDYSFPRGNALIGVARIAEQERALLTRSHPEYDKLISTKNALVRAYQEAVGGPLALAKLRAEISVYRRAAYDCLNGTMAELLNTQGREGESMATDGHRWRGGTRKQDYTPDQIAALDPLHYAFDFDTIMNGGWWERLDGREARVFTLDGTLRVSFGPGSSALSV